MAGEVVICVFLSLTKITINFPLLLLILYGQPNYTNYFLKFENIQSTVGLMRWDHIHCGIRYCMDLITACIKGLNTKIETRKDT